MSESTIIVWTGSRFDEWDAYKTRELGIPDYAREATREESAMYREYKAALRAAQQREEELREALRRIAEGDVPRTVAVPWRETRTKHDKCPHDRAMWDDCDECTADYARAALAKHPAQDESASPT